MKKKLVLHPHLVAMLASSVAAYGARPLFGTKSAAGWSWVTYRDFASTVDEVRGGLAALGVRKGDRIAVIANNRVEWAAACYAAFGLGAAWVPMYEAQLDEEWRYILGNCGAKVCLVANAAIKKRVEGLRASLPGLEKVCSLDEELAELRAAGARAPAPAVELTSDDVATLVYTSGTTGNPKGVMLTHGNLAAQINGINEVVPFDMEARTLSFLPWAHVAGGVCELHGIVSVGGSLALCEAVDKIAANLAEVKPTALVAVPRIWNRIYDGVQKQVAGKPKIIRAIFAAGMRAQSKKKRGERLSLSERVALPLAKKLIFSKIVARFGGNLQFAISGAAALSKDVAEFIDNLGVVVLEGYGMTETCGVSTLNTHEARRIGTVGKALPGVRVELDTTAPGAENGTGEVLIYGPCVMKGYYGLAEETAACITKDGAMRTGDLGRFDADGFLVITGRVKELYKLENGKYVAPAPLEERITLSPYIAQVMVHGANRPYNVALVVPDMGQLRAWAKEQGLPDAQVERLLGDDRTRRLIEAELAKFSDEFKGYERVKNFHLVGEEFTTQNDLLTVTLKVKRRNVLKRYEKELEALYGPS